MNELEFMAVILARNELAHAVCVELDKLRANEENNFYEVSEAWYNFVHEVLFETDGKASLDRGNDLSVAFIERMAKQMDVFRKADTVELRRAFTVWSAIDNGDLRA